VSATLLFEPKGPVMEQRSEHTNETQKKLKGSGAQNKKLKDRQQGREEEAVREGVRTRTIRWSG